MPCIRLPRKENDEQTRKYSFIFISVFNSCPAEEIYLLYPLLVPWGVESKFSAWAQSFYREGQILIPKEIYSTLDPLMPCIRLPRKENDEQTRKYSFIFISVFNSCPAEEIYLLYPFLVPCQLTLSFMNIHAKLHLL